MNRITNLFSFLRLDAGDDKEELATPVTSISDGSKGKGKLSGQSTSTTNDIIERGNLPSFTGNYRQPLVWIDLEMTGLNIEVDRILEIACIITDGKLTNSIEGPDLVINQSKDCLDKMGEWCQTHHAASGLTAMVLKSTTTEEDAEKQVINFVRKHAGTDTPLLAGNSVYVDFLFLKKYMPSLAAMFSHVVVDVSSIKALCFRWFPREKRKAPVKQKNHRAMDDIKESIAELKYYKEAIFKGPNKSKRYHSDTY